MNYRFITYLTAILFILLTSCNKENEVNVAEQTPTIKVPVFPKDDEYWIEEQMDGASVTVKRFEPGDDVTRSSLYYDGQGLVFGWTQGDRIGLYPTAKDATTLTDEEKQGLLSKTDYPHPSLSKEPNLYRVAPQSANLSIFTCTNSSGQTARILNGSSEFEWDEIVRWSACFLPNSAANEEETYEKRSFSFENQTQNALTEVGEYFDWEENVGDKDAHLNRYLWSEEEACKHLGNFDAMISPETKWEDGVRINFQMRHVGAIARIYLKIAEEDLVVKNVKLICETPIFYEKGSFNLISHPYVNDSKNNYGVDLTRTSAGCQIKSEGRPVNMLQLNFTENCVTKKSGSGYGPYIVGYLMMYPITYNPTANGKLYAYVTAYKKGTDPTKEVHYVSEALTKKTMKSGNYYQWTSQTEQPFIELTATLLPWQDIVGGNINTDLTK